MIYVVSFLIGIITAMAGYPVWDNGFIIKNIILNMACIGTWLLIYHSIKP